MNKTDHLLGDTTTACQLASFGLLSIDPHTAF